MIWSTSDIRCLMHINDKIVLPGHIYCVSHCVCNYILWEYLKWGNFFQFAPMNEHYQIVCSEVKNTQLFHRIQRKVKWLFAYYCQIIFSIWGALSYYVKLHVLYWVPLKKQIGIIVKFWWNMVKICHPLIYHMKPASSAHK